MRPPAKLAKAVQISRSAHSINDATTQILYLPVPSQARVSAKAFIDGVVKPVAIGLSGLVLAAYRAWGGGDPYRLAWLSILLCVSWLAVVVSLRSKYLKSLQENLKNRRLDLESARHQVNDSSTNLVLERALASDDAHEVLNALALLPHLEKLTLDTRVELLLEHPNAEIRTRALGYYAHRQTMRFANSVFRRFEDPDPAVRAAAIDAFSAMGRDKAVRSVRAYLHDADPRIRSAAVTGMIRYGGLDGVLVAAEALKALIDNADPVMRLHAARVLGAIGVKNFYQPVLQLMSDEDPRVRREAIIAAGQLRSPEFVIPLIYRTQTYETLREAIDSLTAYGSSISATLAKVLTNRHEDSTIRRAIARVLGRLGNSESVELIAAHLDEPDDELRDRLYRALARSVRGQRDLLQNVAGVQRALDKELERAWRALHQAERLGLTDVKSTNVPRRGSDAARALLASALKEKVAQIERRVFLLLAVLYPDADMEQISAGIRDAASSADAVRRRGNAVELLDNLLDRSLKQRFLPLLEELPRADKLKQIDAFYPASSHDAAQTMVELCRDDVAWVRACAVWCLAEADPRAEAIEVLASSVGDPSAIVREIGLVSLSPKAPERAKLLAESRLADDAPFVRQQAALITATRASRETW